MFIVVDEIDDVIDWPVVVNMPASGGKVRKYKFVGFFKRLSDEQKAALRKSEENKQEIIDIETKKASVNENDEEFIEDYLDRTMAVMSDWSGVVDKEKNPLEYNRKNFKRMLKAPSGTAIIHAITRAIGEIENGIQVKNL
ncbi:hypothetical protein [Undibacterium sp. Ji22W]|uniref:hypothetical protein n=1 Tax=Undibacterium sp. Ji22W TaxID=3413038 RepID=UPI003BF16411